MVTTTRPHPYYHSSTKRVFDIVVAWILLIALMPMLMIISLTILLTSGWPVIFKQLRTGKNNQPFVMYKFRVMYVGAEKDQHRYKKQNQAPIPMYKYWQDPRFVGIGRWLSKSGLDELPQLINILKNEMSFVGPRPLPVSESKKLPQSWLFRFAVKPGVFSEWSASLHKPKTLAEWRKLELQTLTKGGVLYELKVLWRTIASLGTAARRVRQG